MKNSSIVFLLIAATILLFHSCRKDKGETEIDKQLYNEINQSGFTYYQNGSVLAGAGVSPHGSFKLRFNTIAMSALDNTGELPVGNMFPVGSVIVKEITTGNTTNLYAIIKKDPANKYAANGWIWVELETNGASLYSAAKRGSDCTGCHGETPNRDMVRTFDFH